MSPDVWAFITSAGPVALLGWAVLNERRLTRLETKVQALESGQVRAI